MERSVLVGDYENHLYDNGGKNEWHYAELTEGAAPNEIVWTNRANVSWSLFLTDDSTALDVGENCCYYSSGHTKCRVVYNGETGDVTLFGPGDEPFDKVSPLVPTRDTKKPDTAYLLGSYENHLYDNGGKNEWHYAELTEGAAPNEVVWTNRANVSWSLFLTDDTGALEVGQNCCYYSSGHTKCKVIYNRETGEVRLIGPGDEPFDKVSPLVPETPAKKPKTTFLLGSYENHLYDNGGKNEWHYAELTQGAAPNEVVWTNRANVSWSLFLTDDSGVLEVGENCCYYSTGHTKCKVIYNGETGEVRLIGPGDEPFDKVSPLVPETIANTQDIRGSSNPTRDMMNLLDEAAYKKKEIPIDRLKELLDAGADPNGKDKNGRSAVMVVAVNTGAGDTYLPAFQALKEKGADLDAPDGKLFTPLLMAASQFNTAACWALVKSQVGDDKMSRINFSDSIIAQGIKNEALGKELVNASDAGDIHLIQELLEKGVDPNYRHGVDFGKSALHAATMSYDVNEYDFETIVKILVDAGANINLPDKMGNTALHVLFGGTISGPASHGPAFTPIRLAKTRTLRKYGASSNAMNYFPFDRPLGDRSQLQYIFGGTPIMYGSRYREEYDASTDPQYEGITKDFVPLSKIEETLPETFEDNEEAIAAIKEIIRMGFGDEPIFTGKDRAGKPLLNPVNNDNFQVRNQLFLMGHHDLEESERLGSMLGDRLLLPILNIIFNRAGTDSDKKEMLDFAMYLFSQGISDYVKGNLKDVAKKCNEECTKRYDRLYEDITVLRTLTEKKKLTFEEVHDTKHPSNDLNWLHLEEQNTIVTCFELLKSGGVDCMVKFCEFVSSCQGSYLDTYYNQENVSLNFWADVYAHYLVGQAEAVLNEQFQAKLRDAVPEAFRSKIRQGPVKTVTRVKAKRTDYSSLAESFSGLRALGKKAAKGNKKARDEHMRQSVALKQEFLERSSSSFHDRTSVAGVIDICRASVVVDKEEDLVEVFEAVKEAFPVCRIKNGFHHENDVAGSGYRDMKLNLLISHEDEEGYEHVQVTELQLTLKSFENVKKLSHLPYSILRGDFD